MSYYDEDSDALDEDDLWDPWDDEDDDWDALDEDEDETDEETDMHDVPETQTFAKALDASHKKDVAKYIKQVEKEIAKGSFETVITIGDVTFSPKKIAKRFKAIIADDILAAATTGHEFIKMPASRFTHYGIKDKDNELFFFTPAQFKAAKRERVFKMQSRLRRGFDGDEIVVFSNGRCTIGCQDQVSLDQWIEWRVKAFFTFDDAKAEAAVHGFTILRDKIVPKLKRKSTTKRPPRGKSARQSTRNR